MPIHSRKTFPAAARSLDVYPANPVEFAENCLHVIPDAVQANLLLQNPRRCILNCTRQWGKSTITAIKAVHTAVRNPGAMIIALAPTARQSGELVEKCAAFVRELGMKARGDGRNDISLLFPNGARIIGLPGKTGTIRCFSGVSFLLIDEAAWVEDAVYRTVRPMLATTVGPLWIISTPNVRSGFFYDIWTKGGPEWTRIAVTADQCPRIRREFLEEERRSIPAADFRREYYCEFTDAADSLFSSDEVNGFLTDAPPLRLDSLSVIETYHRVALVPSIEIAANLPTPAVPATYYIGVDLGKRNDHSAISVIEVARVVTGTRDPVHYELPTEVRLTVRHVERIPLNTRYSAVVERIAWIVRHGALVGPKSLVVDATGVGEPVVELIRKERLPCRLYPVILTGGESPHLHGGYYYVPRGHLLSRLEVGLTQGHLKICRDMPATPQLLSELLALRQHTPSADHDDLVFATALAANWARAG